MYGIELAYLMGKKYVKGPKRSLQKSRQELQVWQIFLKFRHSQILFNKILTYRLCGYMPELTNLKQIRESLRDLMKYIPKGQM